MNVNLNNAAEVLTACAFACLLLPPFKGKKVTTLVVGGAWALLAVLLVVKHLSVGA